MDMAQVDMVEKITSKRSDIGYPTAFTFGT
jgi:hypothetical protein